MNLAPRTLNIEPRTSNQGSVPLPPHGVKLVRGPVVNGECLKCLSSVSPAVSFGQEHASRVALGFRLKSLCPKRIGSLTTG